MRYSGRSPSWRRTSTLGRRTISYEDRVATFVWEVRSMPTERPRDLLILAGGTDVQGRARSARA